MHRCKWWLFILLLPCASGWSPPLVSGYQQPRPQGALSSAFLPPGMLLQASPFPRVAFHCSLSPHQVRQEEFSRAPGLPCVKDGGERGRGGLLWVFAFEECCVGSLPLL